MTEKGNDRIANFGAGPSQIQLEVLQQAQAEFLSIHGTGMSILEISHRGGAFDKIIKDAEDDLRKILSIPSNYKVLFLQGGGTGQFAAVPLNLLSKSNNTSPDYLITGRWSQLAAEESKLYCTPSISCNGTSNKFTAIPPQADWKLNKEAPYLFYCDNETIHGIEFPFVPEVPSTVALVADMSSNFLSRPVDVSKFGVIYAGAQKNSGMAGLTIVIVREDLLTRDKVHPVPTVLHWKKNSDLGSCLNTPPTMAIYIAGLIFKWILKEGGLTELAARAKKKSDMVYDVIAQSNGFYKAFIDEGSRSRMNIVFTTNPPNLVDQFVKEAEAQGLHGLAGHRSVGGLRASLYNAVTLQQVEKLVSFMKQFQLAKSAQ